MEVDLDDERRGRTPEIEGGDEIVDDDGDDAIVDVESHGFVADYITIRGELKAQNLAKLLDP
ncbi:13486_t:CDS:2 [Cetraspora pellucida]|uniref:13486_t:CDS:1 n=1 Tax=Cetraspora pellucida TaxID=1433469 RepID=A0ACA9KIH9_9GLOM|nr:13486_t:CDS:2 [Cetraspora pellucida]